MTGGLLRILVCGWLVFSASQASAESDAFSVEYRWMTLLGNTEDHVLPRGFDSSYLDTALVRLSDRSLVGLGASRVSSYHFAGSELFRRPDPNFGLPEAFRQPRQARISFRIAF
jgi:hypothetical protein